MVQFLNRVLGCPAAKCFFFGMKSGELLGKAELVREAQMRVRQRFSLLESGAEARLSVRALLRGGAEEIHEAHVRR